MRRLVILVMTILFILSMIPSVSAEKGQDINDHGIKKGTEVYGEDISELTEEELQYIPKGWRDGEFKSRHETEEDREEEKDLKRKGSSTIMSGYPDVNNYIRNMDPVNVSYEHNSDFTEFNYRNGYGAVEGVVAHETANDNSNIRQEISFMSRNHQNAFVHAFVDHNNIIEIHPTDLGAWGAGRYANERFVHVELVRVDSFDEFARSINNYAEYVASILYDYNLGVTSAENDGEGTLWSHYAVSNHLGGTNHVDPHGYFERWGYNWGEFVTLVEDKYKEEVREAERNTSKLGHIKSSNARIYDDPTSRSNYKKAGSAKTKEVFYIKAEAKLGGRSYYLISRKPSTKKGTLGWVQAKDMSTHKHQGMDKNDKTFKVHGSGKAYDKAWGGPNNMVYDLSSYAGEIFKVNLTEVVGDNTWYRGMLDGQEVWIHYSYLIEESRTSKLGHLSSSDVRIYSTLEENAAYQKAGKKYTNAVYYIKEEAEVRRNTYYLVSTRPSRTKGIVGWVRASDMSVHSHVGVDSESKTFTIKGTGNAYAKAWGGSKDHVYDLSGYAGKQFNVHLTEKVGNNIWYRGKLNGKTVWLHNSYVMDIDKSNTSKLGHLRSGSVIYETVGDDSSAFGSDDYLNAVYYIKQQANAGGEKYYLISEKPSRKQGVVGWVRAAEMSVHSHVGVDSESKTFTIKGTGNAYTKAWGGSKNHVYNLSAYAGEQFNVHLTEKVGNNIWYRGKLGGKTVWMHHSYVQ